MHTPKKNRIGHCIFFLTDHIQKNFVFNIGVPRSYLDFFVFGKILIIPELKKSEYYLGTPMLKTNFF